MLRMILPKGTIFSDLTQWDVRKCANHINATPRAKLGGKTPYDLALAKYGVRIMHAMQLYYVSPDDVILSPKLLKK